MVKRAPKKPAGRRKVKQLWGGALEFQPTTLDFERSANTAHQAWLIVRSAGLGAHVFLRPEDIDRLWTQLGRIRADRLAEVAEADRIAALEAAADATESHARAAEAAAEIATATSTPTPE